MHDAALHRLTETAEVLRADESAWDEDDLATLNAAVTELCEIRARMVRQLRAAGRPWARIAEATGVPVTTWRRRHDSAVRSETGTPVRRRAE